MENVIKQVRATDLYCVPTVREKYDKMYTLGVDRRVQNWKGCGTKFVQKLPPVCMPKVPEELCQCYNSYYDCDSLLSNSSVVISDNTY